MWLLVELFRNGVQRFGAIMMLPEQKIMSKGCSWLVFGISETHFLRLLSVTIHSTSSRRQFVHGAPCSTTLHLTFRALQH
jgi:hypothetical protein